MTPFPYPQQGRKNKRLAHYAAGRTRNSLIVLSLFCLEFFVGKQYDELFNCEKGTGIR